MKKILFLVMLLNASVLFAQEKCEYMILRVTYSIKPNGMDSRLEVDLGTSPTHSLKGILENGKSGTLSLHHTDGTVTVIKNEVDFFNIIQTYGFSITNSYSFTVLEKSYANFVLVRKM
jgi:hypothetical protein